MRALIIDANRKNAEVLVRLLDEMAFSSDVGSDGARGSYLARINEYDLIVMQYSLPQKSGAVACVEIRSAGRNTPIIALVDPANEDLIVKILSAGADDCIRNPPSFPELLARIRALLRRGPVIRPDVQTIGSITVNLQTQQVRAGKKLISISKTEFAIIRILLLHFGSLVPRRMIIEHVWGGDTGTSHALESHLHSIRKKLGKSGKHFIKNVPGRGYFIEK